MHAIDAVQAEIADVCGHLHALHGRLVHLTADVLDRELWVQDGIRSPEHWLTWQTGVAHSAARQIVSAARRLAELPVTMAAFEAGELSLDQITPIVDRAPAWADAQACEMARHMTVTQIRTAIGRFPFPADRDPCAEPEPAGEPGPVGEPLGSATAPDADGDGDPHRAEGVDDPADDHASAERCSLVQRTDSTWQLAGRFDADHGAVVDAALREIADAMFADIGRRPSRAEAMVELARRHLSGVTDVARRDRYRVHYLLDETHQLVDPLGHAMPGWLRDLICCDPDLSVTWQRHGVPIAKGSVSATIDPEVRRHVRRRDQGCRVPGCGSRHIHFHHVVHREDGGSNDAENIASVCPYHHRLHHRGLLGISGDAEQPAALTFTDRHGHPMEPNRLIRPPNGPPPTPDGEYRHPLGERLQTKWIDFYRPGPRPRPAPSPSTEGSLRHTA